MIFNQVTFVFSSLSSSTSKTRYTIVARKYMHSIRESIIISIAILFLWEYKIFLSCSTSSYISHNSTPKWTMPITHLIKTNKKLDWKFQSNATLLRPVTFTTCEEVFFLGIYKKLASTLSCSSSSSMKKRVNFLLRFFVEILFLFSSSLLLLFCYSNFSDPLLKMYSTYICAPVTGKSWSFNKKKMWVGLSEFVLWERENRYVFKTFYTSLNLHLKMMTIIIIIIIFNNALDFTFFLFHRALLFLQEHSSSRRRKKVSDVKMH